MSNRIDLLICEPSPIVRTGLAAILAPASDIRLLSPLSDALHLEERLATLQPDCLLINPSLLPPPATKHLASIQQHHPETALIALVYQHFDPALLDMFKAKIDILSPENHIAGIIRDESQRLRHLHDLSPEPEENLELSDRELQVLVAVAQGLSSKEIADRLCISVHTVNSHRKAITRKTGIRSVAGLAVYATLHNLC